MQKLSSPSKSDQTSLQNRTRLTDLLLKLVGFVREMVDLCFKTMEFMRKMMDLML